MSKNSLAIYSSVFLVFIIIFAAFTPVFALPIGGGGEIEVGSSLKENSRNSYYAFSVAGLIMSFPKEVIQTEFGEREIILYPPEYAGCYIDESNNLHILLTKNADYETTKRAYQELMGNDEGIIYEAADFPLFRLYEVQRSLENCMSNFNISCTGINEITNRVDISIVKERENDVVEFLKTQFDDFDERCIAFSGPVNIQIAALAFADVRTPQPIQKMLIIGIAITVVIAVATTGILITKKKQK